jgi:hypothetical protein
MAQVKADSPEVIYDTLIGDTEFAALVGSYNFVGQSTPIDSISVLSPNEKLPQLSSQTGLEVIIHDVGEVRRVDYLTSVSDAVINWKVYLIAWPDANGGTITAATKRIIEIFSNAVGIEIIATPNEIGALVQNVVLIPSNAAIMI